MKAAASSGLLTLALSGSTSALIGYGIPMYKPNCAFACRSLFASAMLECSAHDHVAGAHSHGAGPTSPECRAGDTPWLTTLAYCIKSTCIDVAPFRLEAYWAEQCTGDAAVQPKWTYQETLTELEKVPRPSAQLGEEEMLEFTALYDEETWESYRGTLFHFEYAETMHSRYGIILLVVGFGSPIFFSFLSYLSYMSSLIDKLKPRFVYPSLIGTYHVRALPFALGNAPTTGQTVYIVMFLILNVILTAAGYRSYQPNMFFENTWQEIMGYTSARTGVLAFALAPLVVLLSGRNNVLLWLTNWSHSTYMLLHRWVARIFTLQVILHSLLELVLYQKTGELATEQVAPYWIWGIVATIACVIMVVVSSLFFRRLSYELFLIIHIILAVFVIAGSWYHVELLFTRKWGYEFWIYAVCAVWFSDRLMRVGRILKNGIRKAEVTEIGEDIVRVDIKDVRWDAQPGKHTYAYFPALNPLRPWENHPFSIIPTALLSSRGHSISSTESQHSASDIEKTGASATVTSRGTTTSTSGISLYVRKSTGLTKALTSHAALPTLLDGPYPNTSTAAVLKTDRLVLIAGGIGITAILPFIAHHPNVKLHWSVKASAQGLVDDLDAVLRGVREKQVVVGQRLSVEAVLEREEAEGWKRIGVVVCGPGGLCDDVRSGVARRGREGNVVWELDVEAFSW
ncbi:ferric reductase like transmembrane component-domain-containing protein [Massariosphaeria phaeospora]|uniref:Ferric reductase like transmembrane component-domain-containing protein n=1 Tax=Massariosphaeria phaeospora TaxID=100035 RepID=A0A7C8M3H6_9PLEO|nr:ferric reductase like transmembrane component-domain-containing protein [Massariosphaeria phaeospora]